MNLNEKVFGLSFGIMRIALFLTAVFFDIYILRSYIDRAIPYFDYLLYFHLGVSLILLFGYKYDIFKIFFFICSLVLANSIVYFFNLPSVLVSLTLLANLIILLFPLNSSLSIDKILSGKVLRITLVPRYYYLAIYIILGLFYFEAGYYKLSVYQHWVIDNGILFKKFFTAFPNLFNTNIFVELFLQNRFINTIIASITIVYQLFFFITLMILRKKYKHYFLLFGIFLHLMSALIIDLWYIALFTIILYIPFFENRFYYRLFSFLRSKKRDTMIVKFDSTCMFCSKNIFLIKLFDFNNRIKLKGENLSSENEIILVYKNNIHKGVDAFKTIFGKIYLYYPAYLVLSIPVLFDFFNEQYLKFAAKRGSLQCSLGNLNINDHKYILGVITALYMFLVVITKFTAFYGLHEKLSFIGFPRPATMFLVKGYGKDMNTNLAYIKDENNNIYYFNRLFWENNSFIKRNNVLVKKRLDDINKIDTKNKSYLFRVFDSEDKYVNEFLLNSYFDLEKRDKSNLALANIHKKFDRKISICFKNIKTPYTKIRSLSLNQINQLLINEFNTADEYCLQVK